MRPIFERRPDGCWTVSEALRACKPTSTAIDALKKPKGSTELPRAKVKKDFECVLGEKDMEDEEEKISESWLKEDEISQFEALMDEAGEYFAKARDLNDHASLTSMRKHFLRFLQEPKDPQEQKEKPELFEPELNERHRLKMEARKRGNRLRSYRSPIVRG